MKKTTLLALASLFAILSAFSVLPAQAAAVPLYLLTATSTGEIDTSAEKIGDKEYIYDHGSGEIAAMTQILFTYTYHPPDNPNNAIVVNFANPNEQLSFDIVYGSGSAKGTAQMLLKNLSSAAAAFTTYFLYKDDKLALVTTYGPVASVPLPAALPLFGLGLLGLAGFKRLKGNKNAA